MSRHVTKSAGCWHFKTGASNRSRLTAGVCEDHAFLVSLWSTGKVAFFRRDYCVALCVAGNEIWSAVTRAALCAGRGTAFVRHPATARLFKKRRRAEYRLPPHSKSVYKNAQLPILNFQTCVRLAYYLSLTDYGCDRVHSSMVISQGGVSMAFLPSSSKSSDCRASLVSSSQKSFLSFSSNISKACSASFQVNGRNPESKSLM